MLGMTNQNKYNLKIGSEQSLLKYLEKFLMKIIYNYWIFLPEYIGGNCLFYLGYFYEKLPKRVLFY